MNFIQQCATVIMQEIHEFEEKILVRIEKILVRIDNIENYIGYKQENTNINTNNKFRDEDIIMLVELITKYEPAEYGTKITAPSLPNFNITAYMTVETTQCLIKPYIQDYFYKYFRQEVDISINPNLDLVTIYRKTND